MYGQEGERGLMMLFPHWVGLGGARLLGLSSHLPRRGNCKGAGILVIVFSHHHAIKGRCPQDLPADQTHCRWGGPINPRVYASQFVTPPRNLVAGPI